MNIEDLDRQLVEWGHWYGVRDRPALDADGYQLPPGPRVTGSHPIARAMEFAPGRKANRETLQRGGEARRRTMAMAAGLPGLLPVAFVDHIPCTETRPHLGTPRWPTDPDPIPVTAQRIEAAVRGLVLSDPAWGYALRARYCQRGDAEAKAEWLAERLDLVFIPTGMEDEERYATIPKDLRLNVRGYHGLLGAAKLVLIGRLG